MEKCMFLENNDQKNFNRFILFDDHLLWWSKSTIYSELFIFAAELQR